MSYQDRVRLRFLTSAEILFSNLVSVLKLVPCYTLSKILSAVSWWIYFRLSNTNAHTEIWIQKMNYTNQILYTTDHPQCHQRPSNDFDGQQYWTFLLNMLTPTHIYESTYRTKMSKSNRIVSLYLNFARLRPKSIQKTTQRTWLKRQRVYVPEQWLQRNVA
jgi:hypothetical protein